MNSRYSDSMICEAKKAPETAPTTHAAIKSGTISMLPNFDDNFAALLIEEEGSGLSFVDCSAFAATVFSSGDLEAAAMIIVVLLATTSRGSKRVGY